MVYKVWCWERYCDLELCSVVLVHCAEVVIVVFLPDVAENLGLVHYPLLGLHHPTFDFQRYYY